MKLLILVLLTIFCLKEYFSPMRQCVRTVYENKKDVNAYSKVTTEAEAFAYCQDYFRETSD